MADTVLTRWLVALGVAAAIGLAIVLATRIPIQQELLWIEVGKGLIQVVVIGVVGTVLKLLADAYQARRQQAEARDEFRADKRRRLVATTNVLRKAPILIEANRSVKTWDEQMLTFIDAKFELGAIRHEIDASNSAPNPPFSNIRQIREQLGVMEAYLEWVTKDFSRHKKELSEQQRLAEQQGLSPDERARRQGQVWDAIRGLDSVADLIRDPDARPHATEEPSWAKYESGYGMALDLITRASLGGTRRRPA